jgi:hypothetical protein
MLKILLKAVSEVTIDTHFTVRNFFLLFQLSVHNMLSTHIFIAYYALHVSGFVTPSSERRLLYLLKNYVLFTILLHWLCCRI